MRLGLERASRSVWLLGCLGLLLGCEQDEPPPKTVSVSGGERDASEHDDYFRPPSQIASGGRSRPDGGEALGPAESGKLCESDDDCGRGECFQGICVGQGALRFSLSWLADTDYDLHVLTPSGEEIWFGSPAAGGGVLDVDDCIGGECLAPGGTHVENVFFEDAPASGTYTFWVHNWAGDIADDFEIEVSTESGVVQTESGIAPIAAPAESTRFTYEH